ncbi:MAG: 4-hydroxy-tetrahydrodipicolinate reductase [Promethearchaeota archaeon]|nr:MAG: 4-hydroxy-tetrahydrodipicolinate reductase [Candidatus Lokiarchaeota archaeon]
MIKLLILGPTGEMGKLISKLAFDDPEINIVAALDVNHIGKSLNQIIGSSSPKEVMIYDVKDLLTIIKNFNPNIAVDFTIAKATEENALKCVKNNIKCVIGTTGMSEEFFKKLETLVEEKNVPVVISPNMSTGINVIFKIVENLTSYLKDWDIELIETHHHRKRDVPSGTALKIAEIISQSLHVNLEDVAKYGRKKGLNKRNVGAENEIGIHAIRGGDIVGDHTILFAGKGERIELKHQAQSRLCFAEGAIKAIKFLDKSEEGKVYNTKDFLNL